ncbi:winged helix-turn-helix domain-containing protein [Streptomyces sp. NPDC093589]|uniref:winged helix-turn-helix domain-containing protein n=1 Tax=Streptomyces sp. NPDC093589 TaxID=3366043 RepID=UPI0037FA5B6D
MTANPIDPLLVDPTRLSILSLLSTARWAEFAFVRDTVGLSDSALSKQVTKLSDCHYVEVRRGYVGKRGRTWINLAPAGREALESHIAALQEIITQARATGEAHTPPSDSPGR